jgi:cell division protein FtsQ
MKIYNRLVSELGQPDVENEPAQGTNASTNYVRQLSEVDLSDPENVKVTANDPGGTMVVHLGKEDFLPRYRLYVSHIAEWRQQYQNVQSVDLRYEGQVVVNPDKPSAEKLLPRMNADNADRKRPVLKPVSAKPAVKPVSAKAAKPKTARAKKSSPQRTQRAQR